jgi:hypothetical protein
LVGLARHLRHAHCLPRLALCTRQLTEGGDPRYGTPPPYPPPTPQRPNERLNVCLPVCLSVCLAGWPAGSACLPVYLPAWLAGAWLPASCMSVCCRSVCCLLVVVCLGLGFKTNACWEQMAYNTRQWLTKCHSDSSPPYISTPIPVVALKLSFSLVFRQSLGAAVAEDCF